MLFQAVGLVSLLRMPSHFCSAWSQQSLLSLVLGLLISIKLLGIGELDWESPLDEDHTTRDHSVFLGPIKF